MNGQNFLNQSLFRVPPNDDEIEITIFGRGFGECIVLCCKNQNFIIIDSFINPSTKKPIAIDYLNSLNLPLSSIKETLKYLTTDTVASRSYIWYIRHFD